MQTLPRNLAPNTQHPSLPLTNLLLQRGFVHKETLPAQNVATHDSCDKTAASVCSGGAWRLARSLSSNQKKDLPMHPIPGLLKAKKKETPIYLRFLQHRPPPSDIAATPLSRQFHLSPKLRVPNQGLGLDGHRSRGEVLRDFVEGRWYFP